MKPKSGSQRRMQCVTRTFDPWGRWCTNYQTVSPNCIPPRPTLWSNTSTLYFRSRFHFYLSRDPVDEGSRISAIESRQSFENATPIDALVTCKTNGEITTNLTKKKNSVLRNMILVLFGQTFLRFNLSYLKQKKANILPSTHTHTVVLTFPFGFPSSFPFPLCCWSMSSSFIFLFFELLRLSIM